MVFNESINLGEKNAIKIEMDKTFLKINKLNYFGFYSKSQNGKYIISWLDCSEDRRSCGSRNGGKGTYILCKDDEIILKGRLERPNDGKVGNNGNFIMEDWLFNKDGVKGTGGICYGLDKNGKTLLKHHLNSNIRESAISDEGNFALFQTAFDDNNYDSDKVFFFDLKESNLLWEMKIGSKWPEGYIIKEHERIIYLDHGNGYTYKYDFNGNFLDSKIWDREKLDINKGYKLYVLLLEELNNLNKEKAPISRYEELIPHFNKLLKGNASDNIKSFIYKQIAIIDYKKKDFTGSLSNLKQSLDYYPSLTTKRLYTRVKEENEKEKIHI